MTYRATLTLSGNSTSVLTSDSVYAGARSYIHRVATSSHKGASLTRSQTSIKSISAFLRPAANAITSPVRSLIGLPRLSVVHHGRQVHVTEMASEHWSRIEMKERDGGLYSGDGGRIEIKLGLATNIKPLTAGTARSLFYRRPEYC
jgi:hypothetical protein